MAIAATFAVQSSAGRQQFVRQDKEVAELVAAWRSAASAHALVGFSWSAVLGSLLPSRHGQPPELRDLGIVPPPVGFPEAKVLRRVALVGEVHDNAEHHRLRARQLEPISAAAVVFEQLRTDQQPAIDAFMALPKESRTLDGFLQAVEWPKSGWSKYGYEPLFEAVIAAGLPIYAGDPPKELIRKAAKEGAAALAAEELQRLGLDVPLDPGLHDASLTEIEESHCGAMPKSAFGGMAFAQRVRDATLADAAITALGKHGAVTVFAGNGHVRSDRGVPWYIRQRAPGVPVAATLVVEVEDGKSDAEAYVPRDPAGKPAADFVIFTPRATRDDPCKVFAKSPTPPASAGAPAPPAATPTAPPITKN